MQHTLLARSTPRPTKILVPLDFSPSSLCSLAMAADLARLFDAELFLLNVIPMFPLYRSMEGYPENEALQKERATSEGQLAAHIGELAASGLHADSAVQTGNDIVGNILLTIDQQSVDMVVLSTHGLSGWRPMVFGSIAEKVIKLVQCPVLLMHTKKPVSAADLADPAFHTYEPAMASVPL